MVVVVWFFAERFILDFSSAYDFTGINSFPASLVQYIHACLAGGPSSIIGDNIFFLGSNLMVVYRECDEDRSSEAAMDGGSRRAAPSFVC